MGEAKLHAFFENLTKHTMNRYIFLSAIFFRKPWLLDCTKLLTYEGSREKEVSYTIFGNNLGFTIEKYGRWELSFP